MRCDVKTTGKIINVNVQHCNGGYWCQSFTVDNAVSFFRAIKKLCAMDAEKAMIPMHTQITDKKGNYLFWKADAELLRPHLAKELNYATGKKERPIEDGPFDLKAYFAKMDLKNKKVSVDCELSDAAKQKMKQKKSKKKES